MKTFTAIAMIVLALALAACGDDNDDSSQDTGAQTTTTGTTKSTTTSGDDRKSGSSSSDDKSKSDSSESNSGSSKRSSSKNKTTNSGKGDTTATNDPDRNENAGKKPLYTQDKAEKLSSQLIARRVCKGFLPTETERELKKNKTTYEAIAKNYAKGWPAGTRDEAEKGCLAGLKARKVK